MLRPDQAKESRLEGFEGLDQSKRCCGEMSVMVMSSGKQWLESVRHMRFPKSVEIAAMSDVIAQSIRVQSCFLRTPKLIRPQTMVARFRSGRGAIFLRSSMKAIICPECAIFSEDWSSCAADGAAGLTISTSQERPLHGATSPIHFSLWLAIRTPIALNGAG